MTMSTTPAPSSKVKTPTAMAWARFSINSPCLRAAREATLSYQRLGDGHQRALAPLALEKIAYEAMRIRHDLGKRADRDDVLVAQHRDPARERDQRVEIVGHHHHREAQLLPQLLDEVNEALAAVGIETRRRLVEEQQLGLERQRAR